MLIQRRCLLVVRCWAATGTGKHEQVLRMEGVEWLKPDDASHHQVKDDLAQRAVQTSARPRECSEQHGGAVGRRCIRRRIGESPRLWAGQGLNPEEPRRVVEPRDQC